MKRYLFLALTLSLLASCNKMESPVNTQEPQLPPEEVVDEISFAVMQETKAPQPITSLSSFYVTATTTSGSSETVKFGNVQFSDNGSGVFVGGKMWPASNPSYHFYASNVEIGSGQTIAINSSIDEFNKDVVCAYLSSPTYKQTNQLQFNHILARVGTVTLTDMDSYSSVSLTLKYRHKGTYNIKSGTWSNTGSDQTRTLTLANNNLWIIPGTYSLTLDFKDASGTSKTLTVSQTFLAGKINNITASCKSASVIVGYDNPTVTLTYPNSPIAYNSTSAINPTLVVKQKVYYANNTSEVKTLSSGQYAVSYQAPTTTGLGLNGSTGVVTPDSNVGTSIPARTEYSDITIKSFSYPDIVYTGATSTPTLTYEQTMTTYTAGRGTTSERSFTVTANVTANGKAASGTCLVKQNGDAGESAGSSSQKLTSGATVTYSGNASGFSLASSGTVTANPNVGSGGGTTYSSPSVTVTPSSKTFEYTGGSQTFSVSYSQTKTIAARNSTSNRSIIVSAKVSMHGKDITQTASCTQNGDPGAAGSSENITTGGSVSYSISGTGFSNNSNSVTASSNEGSDYTNYSAITISEFSYPDVKAIGGTATPTVTASQTKTTGRSSTSSRTGTFTVSVTLNEKTGQSTVNLSQNADPGTSTSTTLGISSMSVSYSTTSDHSAATLDSTTGVVTWAQNTTSNDRTETEKVTITSGGQTATETANSKQVKKSGWDVGGGGGEPGSGERGNF